MKAYLITIRIHDGSHDYDEFPIVYAGSLEQARELVWAYLQCGYYHGADPGEWTVTDETQHVIEESHGDRLYSIQEIKEIPVEHANVLIEYIAWDVTKDARQAVETLITYASTKEE